MANAPTEKYLEIELERDLSRLKRCNVVEAWSFVKNDIESHVGKNLVCIPHLIDGPSYDITSIFIKTEQTGARGKRFRTYKPLGLVGDLIDEDKSHTSWHGVSSRVTQSERLPAPETFRLTLLDNSHRRKICVITSNYTRTYIPPHLSPIGKVTFNKTKNEDIAGTATVYLVNEVIKAETVDLYIDVEEYSRVFHYGEPRPLVFSYQKYRLSHQARIIGKKSTTVCSARAKWTGFNLQDVPSHPDLAQELRDAIAAE